MSSITPGGAAAVGLNPPPALPSHVPTNATRRRTWLIPLSVGNGILVIIASIVFALYAAGIDGGSGFGFGIIVLIVVVISVWGLVGVGVPVWVYYRTRKARAVGSAQRLLPAPGISFPFKKSTFTYEELVTATNGFSSANFLGQGGFGSVHRGVLPNGKCVAVKQLKPGSAQGEHEFRTEVEIISLVHHRHLVSLVGYCISGAQRMLVYEFVPNNTLKFHLHGKERPVMSWATRMKIALGSAKGLAYLHEDCQPKIIHRDIKAENILLDDDFVAKVADFGLAKFFPDDGTHVSTQVKGTFGYLDPEYFRSRNLTDKSDVFSFGVVLLELITGREHIYKTQSSEFQSLYDWARPLLKQALEGGNFETLVDPRLQDHNSSEMGRMVACAAACVRHSAWLRPPMSKILRALEGNIPLDDLNEGITPSHSEISNQEGSSNYMTPTNRWSYDLNFNEMA